MLPPNTALIPAQDAVDALIAADGNLHLAAERLHVPHSTLVASIAADPSAQASLNAQLRALTTLHTFDTLRLAKVIVEQQMAEMDPADFARFYTQLVQQVSSLTDPHETTQNVNITEVVLKMLPPDAREALLKLVSPGGADGPPALGVGRGVGRRVGADLTTSPTGDSYFDDAEVTA